KWLAGITELDQRFADDPDHETVLERYGEALEELHGTVSTGLRDDLQPGFDAQARVDIARAGAGMARVAQAGAHDATRAQLDNSLADARRKYLEAADPLQATTVLQGARAAIQSADLKGAIDTETAEATWRAFQEESAEGRVLMMSDAEQIAALSSNGRTVSLIDPVRRAVMLKQAQGRQNAVARQAVNDALTVLNFGMTPADLPAVQALAKGTEYEATLNAAVEDRAIVESFIKRPLPEQAAGLRAFGSRTTATVREVELQQRLGRAHSQIVTSARQGYGLSAARDAGVIGDVAPFDPADPDALRTRASQAQAASAWVGGPVSVVTPEEAAALAGAIDDATPGEVAGLLQGLHEGLGRDGAMSLAGGVAPKRPELSVAISMVPDDPLLAREIVLGGRLVRANPDVKPTKTERIPAIESVVGDLFTPETAGVLENFMDAGTALYAGRKVPTGDMSYDDDEFEEALADVMGRPVEFNGRNVLPPIPGMDDDDLEDVVDRLTDDDLVGYGNGVPVFADGSAFTVGLFNRGLFHTDAQLVTSGPGRYLLHMPGLGYAMTDSGAYELDLRRFIDVR
ncbi:MAG: hypothetical protein ACYS5V_07875, partial [Planctomycetota bacterium]